MLKRVVFFAVVLIALVIITGGPGRDPIASDTVLIPRAQLYARLNRAFTDVETAAAWRAAHSGASMAPVVVHVTREDGNMLDMQAESRGRKAQVKVWLDDTGSPATTDVDVKMEHNLLWGKVKGANTVERVEATLSRMAMELELDTPELSIFYTGERSRPQN